MLSILGDGAPGFISLHALSFRELIARLHTQIATFASPQLQGRVHAYFAARVHEDSALVMDMTKYLLGPPRKYLRPNKLLTLTHSDAQPFVQPSLPDAHAPEPPRPDPPPPPSDDTLEIFSAMLHSEGTLTKAMAAERAEQMLDIIKRQTQELATVKSELAYMIWTQKMAAAVSSMIATAPDSHAYRPLCVASPVAVWRLNWQRMSRANLAEALQRGSDPMRAAHIEQSQRIAAIGDACAVLKSMALRREQPKLHLMYMHSVALTEG